MVEEEKGNQFETQTVVFADIAGSTALYERVGDVGAEQSISEVIGFMSNAIKRHNGILIKTIGDEVMCRFGMASDALLFAVEVQQVMSVRAEEDPQALRVRIGMQHGSVIMKEGDLFGDTVNVAARMAGLAMATQIIATSECVEAGVASGVEFRRINSLFVKGREQPVDVCEVLWRADDSELTTLSGSPPGRENLQPSHWPFLVIDYGGASYQLKSKEDRLIVGRSGECGIVLPSSSASRIHIELSLKRGKILLTDRSTNGTFVKFDTGEQFFVHKEELALTREGVISLGAPFADNSEVGSGKLGKLCQEQGMDQFLLTFRCHYSGLNDR